MAVDRNRKFKSVEVTEVDFDYSTLTQAQAEIARLIAEYGESAKLTMSQRQYSDDRYLALEVQKPETDAEMAERIANEERWEAQRAAARFAEFQKMKAEFEGDK